MKKLSFFNGTGAGVTASAYRRGGDTAWVAPQSLSQSFYFWTSQQLDFRLSSVAGDFQNESKTTSEEKIALGAKVNPAWQLIVPRRRKRGRWELLELRSLPNSESCAAPWVAYRFKVSRSEHRIVLLTARNLASFLKDMPDCTRLSSLLLPGTHNTLAFYGYPFAQCQFPIDIITSQLHSGIRILDIRLAVRPSGLVAYHGSMSQRFPFPDFLSRITAYLQSPIGSSETVVMSIKQEEDGRKTPPSVFSALVHDVVALTESQAQERGSSLWYLEGRIPTLGEVRGKIVLFSRFGPDGGGWEGGLGIRPTRWPDSAYDGFEWECDGTLVRTQDWYAIPSFLSISEKFKKATEILYDDFPTLADTTLAITYASAASYPFALPPTVALGFGWPKWGLGIEGMNSRLGRWLLEMLSEDPSARLESESPDPRCDVRGWVFMDYFSRPVGLAALLIECNYNDAAS